MDGIILAELDRIIEESNDQLVIGLLTEARDNVDLAFDIEAGNLSKTNYLKQ